MNFALYVLAKSPSRLAIQAYELSLSLSLSLFLFTKGRLKSKAQNTHFILAKDLEVNSLKRPKLFELELLV